MKPIVLLWPSHFPRSAIEADLGVPASAFLVLDVDQDRSALRLEGLPADATVLDPFYLSNAGQFGARARARFREIVRGVPDCRLTAIALAAERRNASSERAA